MQKIVTNLWYDKEAKEASELYVSVFQGSKIINDYVLHNTPSGSVDILDIDLWGQNFTLISAGPLFKFTPAISFLVNCESSGQVDEIWNKLSKGGSVLMELGTYPFSERYGWLTDRYGLSWQLMSARKEDIRQKIVPVLMFTGKQSGKAEEAMKYYVEVFRDGKIESTDRYEKGEEPDVEGTVKHATFTLLGQEFAAMDSAKSHDFTFNEAISFLVRCEDQGEIDYYWEKLSADPESEQCGWLKDKYGVSWQIAPAEMDDMLRDKDENKIKRVTEAFLKMKKLDLEALRRAYENR